MATRDYCNNISEALEVWSTRLHELSGKIDRLSTGDKYKVFPQIEGLHIFMTELDDRICQLLEACPLVEDYVEEADDAEISRLTGQVIANADRNREQFFDYEFGG